MYKIYALTYNNVVCYIGQTTLSLSRRFNGEHYNIPYDKKNMNIFLIEETDDVSRESFWINKFKSSGYNLLNKRGGNTGITTITERKEFDRLRKNKLKNNSR